MGRRGALITTTMTTFGAMWEGEWPVRTQCPPAASRGQHGGGARPKVRLIALHAQTEVGIDHGSRELLRIGWTLGLQSPCRGESARVLFVGNGTSSPTRAPTKHGETKPPADPPPPHEGTQAPTLVEPFRYVGEGYCRGGDGEHVNGRVRWGFHDEGECIKACLAFNQCNGYAFGLRGRCFLYGQGLEAGLPPYESPGSAEEWEGYKKNNALVVVAGGHGGMQCMQRGTNASHVASVAANHRIMQICSLCQLDHSVRGSVADA